MPKAGLAAIVRWFFQDHEATRVPAGANYGVLLLEKMYYADQILAPKDDCPCRKRKVDKKELYLALSLIQRFICELDLWPAPRTLDGKRLARRDRKKGRGEVIEAPKAEERDAAPDLLAALRESVEHAQRGRNGRSSDDGRRSSRTNGSKLGDLTVGQLSRRASRLGIEGRSTMSKRQLVSAIEKAER